MHARRQPTPAHMESATLGVIFVGVWLGLVLLYCLFKVCGGRFVDIISCDCFSGPCCECFLMLNFTPIHSFTKRRPFAFPVQVIAGP